MKTLNAGLCPSQRAVLSLKQKGQEEDSRRQSKTTYFLDQNFMVALNWGNRFKFYLQFFIGCLVNLSLINGGLAQEGEIYILWL